MQSVLGRRQNQMKKNYKCLRESYWGRYLAPKRNNEGECEIRSNKNLENLKTEPNIVWTLNNVRIGWAGVAQDMHGVQKDNWTNNYMETKRKATRGRQRPGRQNGRPEDIGSCKNAEETARDREDWRQYVVAGVGPLGTFSLLKAK